MKLGKNVPWETPYQFAKIIKFRQKALVAMATNVIKYMKIIQILSSETAKPRALIFGL
jgi:hypothetical protein